MENQLWHICTHDRCVKKLFGTQWTIWLHIWCFLDIRCWGIFWNQDLINLILSIFLISQDVSTYKFYQLDLGCRTTLWEYGSRFNWRLVQWWNHIWYIENQTTTMHVIHFYGLDCFLKNTLTDAFNKFRGEDLFPCVWFMLRIFFIKITLLFLFFIFEFKMIFLLSFVLF